MFGICSQGIVSINGMRMLKICDRNGTSGDDV